jgi:hypothetical protein
MGIGLLLVGFAVRCVSAGMTNEAIIIDGDRLVSALRTASGSDRVAETFCTQRSGAILKLLALFRESDVRGEVFTRQTQIGIIRVLGKMRAAEAVPLLIEHIDIEPFLIDAKTMETMRPAVYALADIGKPASTAVMICLVKERNESRRKLLCEVLRLVEGVPVGRFMIENALQKSTDSSVKDRFRSDLGAFGVDPVQDPKGLLDGVTK